jgi:hypothetical protein
VKKYLPLVALAVACGDDAPTAPDAAAQADAEVRPDAGDPCDHREQDDAGNETAAESSGIVLGGERRICGQVDSKYDTDQYSFRVGDGRVLMRLSAPGNMLDALEATVVDHGTAVVRGVHGVVAFSAENGTLTVVVQADDADELVEPVAYEVLLQPDDPASRCPTGVGPPAYMESHDGAGNLDNDVVSIEWEPAYAGSLTAAPADVPETSASALTVSAGMTYLATGSAGVNAAATDAYQDRDTYLIASGGETNELSVRVAWTGPSGDFDFVVFPVATDELGPALVMGTHRGESSPEFATTAVFPSTSYWLWVGSADGSPVPSPYTLTLCGASFTP